MISLGLVHIIALMFVFTATFGNSEYRHGAIVVFIFSLVNIMLAPFMRGLDYVQALEVLIKIDAITVLFLCLSYKFNKFSMQQAVLVAFATICHAMLLYELTISSNYISDLFYSYYDELIILVGVLQIMAAKDGIISAYTRVRRYLLCFFNRRNNSNKNNNKNKVFGANL